jgi:hypothetical protein
MNLRERAAFKAAQDIWDRTGQPVSADTIAQRPDSTTLPPSKSCVRLT